MKDSFKLNQGLSYTSSDSNGNDKDRHPGYHSKSLSRSASLFDRFGKAFKRLNKIYLFYTLIIFFNHFAFGVSVNIVGATLVDIAFIYDVALNTVSTMVVANNIGYTAGALAGYLYKWVNRQLSLVVFTLFISLTTFGFAHYGNVIFIFIAISINGIGCGAWDAANSVWLVDMHKVGSTAVLQAAQFMYGAGITLAPVLASNFVYGEQNTTDDGTPLTVDMRKETLAVPYIITGIVQSIAPVLLLVLYFVRKYEDPLSPSDARAHLEVPSLSSKLDLNNNDHLEAAREKNRSLDSVVMTYNSGVSSGISQEKILTVSTTSLEKKVPWRKTKLILCGICLAAYFSAENGYFYYCTAMLQYLEIHLTAVEATKVTSVLSLAYTIGPLVTAIVSLKLQPDHIISYHFVFLISGWSLIYFFRTDLTMIYIGSAVLGYGFSAMVPAINAFTERHFKFSDTVASMYTCTCGATSLLIPFLLGVYFDENPLLLMYMVSGFIIISLTFFLLVRVWIALSH